MRYHRPPRVKFCHWVSLIFFICSIIVSGPVRAVAPSKPELVAQAAALIDADTGRLLYTKNPDLKLPVASTTKILTALLVLERGSLTDKVTISEKAAFQEGSSMYTSPGETYTVEELLYGLMLNSGNDAALALAEYVNENVADFAEAMNERARQLGALNTNFTNSSGLPDPDSYSTAKDMALIARAAMARNDFREIAGTKERYVPWPVKDTDKLLVNHNKLLWRYEGADGVKTGYTSEARQCLVASASRQGRRLIAVVLKSEQESVWRDAQLLLDWGFTNFYNRTLVSAGETLDTVSVKKGQADEVEAVAKHDLLVTLDREQEEIKTILEGVPSELEAPVDQGQPLGQAVFTAEETEIGRVPLLAGTAVPRVRKPWWFWLGLLILLRLIWLLIVRAKRRRRLRHPRWIYFRYRKPK
ncbi:MAG: D-alanyl-D-alanine carboxypeptidase [Firmicutes bacterium]|nr:D-alanyl-D-alanine carboxypeptidase [Bacillota bacterium]